MLESLQMGSFHTIVLVVAFIILIIILMVVGFGIKNTSKAVAFPPVPSACPNKWTSGADLSGNPTCTLSDLSFNMPQIVAIGADKKSVYSANGDQWNTITENLNTYTGLADISGNTWIITQTAKFYDASFNNTVESFNKTEISTAITDISGVVATNANECYVYGGTNSTDTASNSVIQKITYTGSAVTPSDTEYLYIPNGTITGTIHAVSGGKSVLEPTATGTLANNDKFVYNNTTYTITKTTSETSVISYTVTPTVALGKNISSAIPVKTRISGTVIGLAYKPTSTTDGLFLAIVRNGTIYTLYSSTYTSSASSPSSPFDVWKSRGKVPTDFTPKCITYADNRFFMGGGNTSDNIIYSTAGNMPTGDITWTPRAKKADISGNVAGIIYTDNKRLIAISDSTTATAADTTIITSTNGSTWTSVAKGDTFSGGRAIGFRKNTTVDKDLNVGSGFIKSVGNVKWDDAYKISLGTSTICEQRNWANGNKNILWDGVSNYNSC